uniref:Uncharacterized protein n=1 Tax=Stegastes partitus TaxID=144197 RepID=A0A3B4Z887_9TELE
HILSQDEGLSDEITRMSFFFFLCFLSLQMSCFSLIFSSLVFFFLVLPCSLPGLIPYSACCLLATHSANTLPPQPATCISFLCHQLPSTLRDGFCVSEMKCFGAKCAYQPHNKSKDLVKMLLKLVRECHYPQ